MTRRRFLQGVVLALVAAIAAAWMRLGALRRWLANRGATSSESPAARLHAQFSFLTLEADAADAYVNDFERHIGPFPAGGEWPDHIYTRFLLSTDFFQNGGDESRRVQYVRFYDPYVSVCYNPLARFDARG